MASRVELVGMVDEAFDLTALGLGAWPDPHRGGPPRDDEYLRVTDAGKWRIVGARADAWLVAIERTGLGVVQRDASVRWVGEPGVQVSRLDRVSPTRPAALPLVVARSRVGDVEDAGVTFGVGDPTVCVAWLPDCGCDACDSGSQNELDEVDRLVVGIISGIFRRLTSGEREITQFDAGSWSASGAFGRREVDAILADARGWKELSGPSWCARP